MSETETKKKRQPFAGVDTTKVILRSRRSEIIEYGPSGVRRRKVGGKGEDSETIAALKRSIAQRRSPAAPPVPTDQPRKRGRPRKNQPEVLPHLATTTETVRSDWDEQFGHRGQQVQVRNSLRIRLRRIDCESHRSEVDEFIAAYETADRGIRAQSYEMAVDGGGSGGANMPIQKLEAARYLDATLKRIGRDAYDLCVGYLCLGVSAREIKDAGGHDEKVVIDRIRSAVFLLVGRRRHDEANADRTMDAVRALLKRQGMGLS